MGSVAKAKKLANKLASEGPLSPQTATKKQRKMVSKWVQACKKILEGS